MKIMSSRYERRRERDSEPDERTQRSASPGPPRKRSRPDVDPSTSRVIYQRPRSPSPNPNPSTPRYHTAATYHKPPQTPTPNVRSHQDVRHKPSPRLLKTPQSSFSAQPSAPAPKDPKDSPSNTSKSNGPLKISSALATLSSSTALSSILSRTDGAEPPQRTTNSISQSPTPASVLGGSTTQFDLHKLQGLSRALQNHGPVSAASTNGNDNPHVPKPATAPAEPRSTHSVAAERSRESLVCCPILCFILPVANCLRWRRPLNLTGNISVRVRKMKEDPANDELRRAHARVSDCYIVVATERRALDHNTWIALTPGTGRQCSFLVNVLGPLSQYREGLCM